ncbi:MAG: hypothetical protein HUU04_06105 [Verrucomicrobiae bacterium]|nr:hypothetical protein [Verrucomicrobiae bacterium]
MANREREDHERHGSSRSSQNANAPHVALHRRLLWIQEIKRQPAVIAAAERETNRRQRTRRVLAGIGGNFKDRRRIEQRAGPVQPLRNRLDHRSLVTRRPAHRDAHDAAIWFRARERVQAADHFNRHRVRHRLGLRRREIRIGDGQRRFRLRLRAGGRGLHRELHVRATAKEQRLLRDDVDVHLVRPQRHERDGFLVLNELERIQREYSTDLAAIVLLPLRTAEAPPASPAAEGDEPAEMEKGYSPAADLPFDSWETIAARVGEVRAKLQSLGPVSVEAVQEYQEQEERHRFLTQQFEDLSASKENLTALIRKINVETRRMFGETFEKIRGNFQQVFGELFGGGKADLALVDDDDPLECGIDIVARPPGKQLQSISLLSGGERTMTAVALLFAIYMVKPSPFCVLDEMDAPLDESNIGRFTGMLQRFLTQSQFLIITHNKRTIAMADALYGVTMEERGVSKLVSVRFRTKANDSAKEEPPRRDPSATGFVKNEDANGATN